MVCALTAGTAHTVGELARQVGVAPATASEHLARLLDAGLVVVEPQGRRRYYRLAGVEVARMVEMMVGAVPPVTAPPRPRMPAGLAFARSCYDHLAGELGVRLYDRLVAVGAIGVRDDDCVAAVTTDGVDVLAALGIAGPAGGQPGAVARTCVDWSQRRHHLGGALGAELLAAMLERRWLDRHPAHRRQLRLTGPGRAALRTRIGLDLDTP